MVRLDLRLSLRLSLDWVAESSPGFDLGFERGLRLDGDFGFDRNFGLGFGRSRLRYRALTTLMLPTVFVIGVWFRAGGSFTSTPIASQTFTNLSIGHDRRKTMSRSVHIYLRDIN